MPDRASALQTRVTDLGVAAEPSYDGDQQAGAALVGDAGSATAHLLASELLIEEVSIDGMCGVY
jgi:mycofactocin precursor